jgi:hypothetical protein
MTVGRLTDGFAPLVNTCEAARSLRLIIVLIQFNNTKPLASQTPLLPDHRQAVLTVRRVKRDDAWQNADIKRSIKNLARRFLCRLLTFERMA